MMLHQQLQAPRRGALTLNPLAEAPADMITSLLRQLCAIADTGDQQQSEIDDQLEALVPALVELRDAGHLRLNMAAAVSYASLEGFMQLADDARLSPLSRARCEAIRNRFLANSIRALFEQQGGIWNGVKSA
jgi:hypothetical protein